MVEGQRPVELVLTRDRIVRYGLFGLRKGVVRTVRVYPVESVPRGVRFPLNGESGENVSPVLRIGKGLARDINLVRGTRRPTTISQQVADGFWVQVRG